MIEQTNIRDPFSLRANSKQKGAMGRIQLTQAYVF